VRSLEAKRDEIFNLNTTVDKASETLAQTAPPGPKVVPSALDFSSQSTPCVEGIVDTHNLTFFFRRIINFFLWLF
jgi:hypothetical protein